MSPREDTGVVTVFAEAVFLQTGQTLLASNPLVSQDPSTTPSPPIFGDSKPTSRQALSGAAKIGIGIGSMLTASFLLFLVYFYMRRHRKKIIQESARNESSMNMSYEEYKIEPELGGNKKAIESESGPTTTHYDLEGCYMPRDSHGDCIYIQKPELEGAIRERRDPGMQVRQRPELKVASVSCVVAVNSTSQISPIELEAGSVFPVNGTGSRRDKRASSMALPSAGAYNSWHTDARQPQPFETHEDA
jgi:hypothetical protein